MTTPTNASLEPLKWPESAQDVPSSDAVSLNVMLESLQLIATDADRAVAAQSGWKDGTPASMQVIKSGALEITKFGTKTVGAVGGLAGVLAAVAGGITAFTTKVGEPVAIAFIGAAAFLLGSVAIALALFVKGDLEARGTATAARHAGRAEVAAAFMRATAALPPAPPAPAPPGLAAALAALAPPPATNGSDSISLPSLFLQVASVYPNAIRAWTATSGPQLVKNMRRDPGGADLLVELAAGGTVMLKDIVGFSTN
jgi:hypothetical protein